MDVFTIPINIFTVLIVILVFAFFVRFLLKKRTIKKAKTSEIQKDINSEKTKELIKKESIVDNNQEKIERDIKEKVGLYFENGSKIEISENSTYSKKIVELADKILEKEDNI